MRQAGPADATRMKAVLRARRLLPLCALPIALWSAAPSIRWCAISWADFPECMVRAPGGRCDLAQPSEPQGAEAPGCDAEVWAWGLLCDPTACAAGCVDSERPTFPDDSRESRGSTRGFCIRGPVGGDGVKPELVDDSQPQPAHPLPVAAFDADVASARPARALAEWSRPPTPPRAIRPPVRAPPLA